MHEAAARVMGVGVRMVGLVSVVSVVSREVGETATHGTAARIPRRQLHWRRETLVIVQVFDNSGDTWFCPILVH